jgi:hypothetical protein
MAGNTVRTTVQCDDCSVARPAMSRFHPSFDLTGEHLIYTGAPAGAAGNLFIANVDGTHEMALTTATDKFVEKMCSWVYAE